MARLRPVYAAAACLSYPAACHAAVAFDEPRWVVLAVAIVAAALSWSRGRLFTVGVTTTALLGGLSACTAAPALVLYAPPVALNLTLCVLFGATLFGEREPMVSRFARAERGDDHLPEDLAGYTRALTALWSMFFAAMAAISASLACWGTPQTWSVFTNAINYGLVAVFFCGEYVYRRIRFAHHHHASPAEVLQRLHTYRVIGRRREPMR